MNRLIQKLKRLLVDRIDGNVNDYDFRVSDDKSNQKELVVIATNRYVTDVHTLRISKLNLNDLFESNLGYVTKPYVYNHNALTEINDRYDLQLTEDDVEMEKVLGDSFNIKIKATSLHYSGAVKIKVTSSNQDLIAYFDNKTEINFQPNKTLETKYLLRHLTFTYMEDLLQALKVGNSLEPKVLDSLLYRLPKFNNIKIPSENNLFGTVVVGNQKLDSSFTSATRVLKLGLNKKFCTNLKGIIEIYY